MTVGIACVYEPHAFVLARGQVVFPDSLADCPGYRSLSASSSLAAGAQIEHQEHVIMLGPTIRAQQALVVAGRSIAVVTPPIHLRLTANDGPQVTIRFGAVPVARLHPAGRPAGSVLYVTSYTRLAQHGTTNRPGFVGVQGLGDSWHQQSGLAIRPVLFPPYVRVVGWHAFAGWLNHSAAPIIVKQP
jgi:hypothetical protein